MIDQNLLQEFKTQKEIIRYLLEKHPESRKNSNSMMAVYIREIFGIPLTEEQIEFMSKSTSLRTVVRVRVTLSNQGVYPFEDDPVREDTFKISFKKGENEEEFESNKYGFDR